MAVVAGFFRRGVVVDIINWPVSLSSVLSEEGPAGWRRVPPTLSMWTLVQTFAVIANGTSTTEYQFLKGVASLSRSLR
jgi:hypothetical protein